MKITPSWVGTFETNLQTLIQSAWDRRLKTLVWDKFMDVKTSTAGTELYFWLLETAKIQTEGQGGNKRFDDLAANFFAITNVNAGNGLRLTKNEIEDNQMQSPMLRGMPALEYSANWATQIGKAGVEWPEELLFQMIAAGKTNAGYDGVAFFNASHPVNPYNTGSGVYSNLYTALPIDATNASTLNTAATNFATAVANVQALTQPNGQPRGLVVRHALCGPDLRKRIYEVLDTKYYGTGEGATENVLSRYGIEPVISPKLTETGVYYLACEMLPGEGGPFIFQDREPYVLSSYQPETLAELQRRKEFEWSFDGRNAGFYGHPYLFFRVEPT